MPFIRPSEIEKSSAMFRLSVDSKPGHHYLFGGPAHHSKSLHQKQIPQALANLRLNVGRKRSQLLANNRAGNRNNSMQAQRRSHAQARLGKVRRCRVQHYIARFQLGRNRAGYEREYDVAVRANGIRQTNRRTHFLARKIVKGKWHKDYFIPHRRTAPHRSKCKYPPRHRRGNRTRRWLPPRATMRPRQCRWAPAREAL